MITTDDWIAMDPENYRQVASLDLGRAFYVRSVGKYLVALKGSVDLGSNTDDEGEELSREVWCSDLVQVVQLIGGHEAEIGSMGGLFVDRAGGQLVLDLVF